MSGFTQPSLPRPYGAAGTALVSNGPAASPTWQPGGSVAPGSPIVRHFPFTFATAGLATGAALYVPTIGDLLLDGWIEVDIAFNGITPTGDFGTFTGTGTGLLHINAGQMNMAIADAAPLQNAGLLAGASSNTLGLVEASAQLGTRIAPAKFTAANPIKVCVSTTGATTGAATGATVGAGVLYLVTCTPV